MSPRVLIDAGISRLEHYPGWLAQNEADHLLANLQVSPTRQNRIRMFGKWLDEPRLTAWYGPAYTYSNISWEPQALPENLEVLSSRIQSLTSRPLNAVLLNHYRTGADGMGWHRDNEPEIDQTLVASISVGATRRFSVKPVEGGTAVSVDLAHGDLLLMWHLQTAWKHQLPKTKKAVGERFNLTFRWVDER